MATWYETLAARGARRRRLRRRSPSCLDGRGVRLVAQPGSPDPLRGVVRHADPRRLETTRSRAGWSAERHHPDRDPARLDGELRGHARDRRRGAARRDRVAAPRALGADRVDAAPSCATGSGSRCARRCCRSRARPRTSRRSGSTSARRWSGFSRERARGQVGAGHGRGAWDRGRDRRGRGGRGRRRRAARPRSRRRRDRRPSRRRRALLRVRRALARGGRTGRGRGRAARSAASTASSTTRASTRTSTRSR